MSSRQPLLKSSNPTGIKNKKWVLMSAFHQPVQICTSWLLDIGLKCLFFQTVILGVFYGMDSTLYSESFPNPAIQECALKDALASKFDVAFLGEPNSETSVSTASFSPAERGVSGGSGKCTASYSQPRENEESTIEQGITQLITSYYSSLQNGDHLKASGLFSVKGVRMSVSDQSRAQGREMICKQLDAVSFVNGWSLTVLRTLSLGLPARSDLIAVTVFIRATDPLHMKDTLFLESLWLSAIPSLGEQVLEIESAQISVDPQSKMRLIVPNWEQEPLLTNNRREKFYSPLPLVSNGEAPAMVHTILDELADCDSPHSFLDRFVGPSQHKSPWNWLQIFDEPDDISLNPATVRPSPRMSLPIIDVPLMCSPNWSSRISGSLVDSSLSANILAGHVPVRAPLRRHAERQTSQDWGLREGEKDRMVYVSWLPRVARAEDVPSKRRKELLAKESVLKMGVKGLRKVLLYPPASAHCKLLFDSEESARRFLLRYGGRELSYGSERWKRDVCEAYDVCIDERQAGGISSTKVKVIWADERREEVKAVPPSFTGASYGVPITLDPFYMLPLHGN